MAAFMNKSSKQTEKSISHKEVIESPKVETSNYISYYIGFASANYKRASSRSDCRNNPLSDF